MPENNSNTVDLVIGVQLLNLLARRMLVVRNVYTARDGGGEPWAGLHVEEQ